jgi:hypothetical protein
MWALLGGLLLIIGLLVVNRRYKRLQQRTVGKFEQALAIGRRALPPWKVWGGMSGTVIAGFAGSKALGIDGIYGSLVVAFFTFLYFEHTRYPRVLITTTPHVTRVIFEGFYWTTIDIDENSHFLLDEKQLELRDEGKLRRIVLFRHVFPNIDFHALLQWLTQAQQHRTEPTKESATKIGGFRRVEGISDLFFLRQEQPILNFLLLFWVGLLIFGMKKVCG